MKNWRKNPWITWPLTSVLVITIPVWFVPFLIGYVAFLCVKHIGIAIHHDLSGSGNTSFVGRRFND